MAARRDRALLATATVLVIGPIILLAVDKIELPRHIDRKAMDPSAHVAFTLLSTNGGKESARTSNGDAELDASVFILDSSDEADIFVAPRQSSVRTGRLEVIAPLNAHLIDRRWAGCAAREDTNRQIDLDDPFPRNVDPEARVDAGKVAAKFFVIDDVADCDYHATPYVVNWRQPVQKFKSSLSAEAALITVNPPAFHGLDLCCQTSVDLKVVIRGSSDKQLQDSIPSPNRTVYLNEGHWTAPTGQGVHVVARATDRRSAVLADLIVPVMFLGAGILLGSINWSGLRR